MGYYSDFMLASIAWFCLSLATLIFAPDSAGSPLPQSTTAQSATSSAKLAEDPQSKEPYVMEFVTTRVAFNSDGTGSRELEFRAKLQSEAAVRELGVLIYTFAGSFESIEIIRVRVHKTDGSFVDTR